MNGEEEKWKGIGNVVYKKTYHGEYQKAKIVLSGSRKEAWQYHETDT